MSIAGDHDTVFSSSDSRNKPTIYPRFIAHQGTVSLLTSCSSCFAISNPSDWYHRICTNALAPRSRSTSQKELHRSASSNHLP